MFYFLNFLAESTFWDIDTVGDPKTRVFSYNVSSSICGGITWTFSHVMFLVVTVISTL